jgi:4-amino-4-deoxy-L-arabinose transferase-like glycosyltransferase
MNIESKLCSGKLAWYRLAALLVAVVAVGRIGLEVLPDWRNVKGWEAYWIAQPLAAGKGYSFPSTRRWLFDHVSDGGFHPTAWVDPLYTFCLAGLIRLFGNYHQLAAAVFNLVLLLAVFGLTYRLGERLISAPAGLIAVLTLSLIKAFPWTAKFMNNTMLATIFIVLSALMLVKFLEGPSYRRAGMLGLVLGLTALACPSALFFIPVTAVAIAVGDWRPQGLAVTQAILMLVVAALTMLPWIARNYLTFGEFVPVRTGAGQIAFISVVGSAGTVAPDKLRSHVKPSWKTEDPYFAVFNLSRPAEFRALMRFQMDYAKELGNPEFATLNEAQRDAWFLKETKAFLLANPVLSLQLAIAKVKLFLRIPGGSFGMVICLLAAAGGLMAIKTPAALTLALWVATFVGPFLIITPFYYRYRAPIEPILAVLAVFASWKVLGIGIRKLVQVYRSPARPAERSFPGIESTEAHTFVNVS